MTPHQARVYESLKGNPKTVRVLAKRLGLANNTVYNHLVSLIEQKAVGQVPGTWPIKYRRLPRR